LTQNAFFRGLAPAAASVAMGAILSGSACSGASAVLTRLVEARRLASDLQVSFTRASDASNRAVMSDTNEAAAAAVDEARQARQAVERDLAALDTLLRDLGYSEDVTYLEGFETRFNDYKRLDDEILPLAAENTNLAAQRLSFGAAQEARDAFARALDAAVRPGAAGQACCADALAAKAAAAVLEIQVLHAPHIAEADDAAMTRLEQRMAAAEAAARTTLAELKTSLAPASAPQLVTASQALDRFAAINKEIIALSRRNSDVRSLALSLGRKRMLVAACEDQLTALQQALAKHGFTATR
jgi:hypothetical protein